MKKSAPWLFLILLVAAFAAWYLLQRPAPESHPSIVALPEVREPATPPKAEFPLVVNESPGDTPPEPLPPLVQSDEAVSEALAAIAGAERLGSLLVLEQIINRLVATVDSLDARQVAPLVWPVRPAEGEFRVEGEQSLRIHPANSSRYDPYLDLVAATETSRVADFYLRYYPLFQEAYEQLGYEGKYFNDRLVNIIDHLLATPGTPETLEVVKVESVYQFTDQRMERLSAGQKVLLRLGADQRAVVERKLEDLRAAVAGETKQ